MKGSSQIKKVAVVGADGRMGKWFTHYFAQSNTMKLYVYDKKRVAYKSLENVNHCKTIRTCVKDADFVIVCVPIESIVSVVQECLVYMKEGSILSEISSIKKQIFGILRASRNDIKYLCIHPMFGPATKRSRIIKNLLIPVRNEAKELSLLKSIFPLSQVEVIRNPDLHDEYMAIVLGLTYFVNLILGSMLSKLDLRTIKKAGGTSFEMQDLITESILNDSPELVSSLLRENPFNERYMTDFLLEAEKIKKFVSGNEESAVRRAVDDIKIRMNKLTDTDKSYSKFYSALEYLKTLDINKMN